MVNCTDLLKPVRFSGWVELAAVMNKMPVPRLTRY
jgi:hypothetical protein